MNEKYTKAYVDNLDKIKGTIEFIYEYENNKQLNFLDTTLTLNEDYNKIDIRWFRKITAADRLNLSTE